MVDREKLLKMYCNQLLILCEKKDYKSMINVKDSLFRIIDSLNLIHYPKP